MLLYLRFPETPAGRRSNIGTRCLSPPHGPPCLAAAQRTDEDRLRPGLHFEMRGADRSAPTDRPSSICQTARSLSLSAAQLLRRRRRSRTVKVASGIRRQNQKQDDAAALARRALRGCRVRRKLDSIDMISNAHLTRRNAAERERERERQRERENVVTSLNVGGLMASAMNTGRSKASHEIRVTSLSLSITDEMKRKRLFGKMQTYTSDNTLYSFDMMLSIRPIDHMIQRQVARRAKPIKAGHPLLYVKEQYYYASASIGRRH